jgi:hypothetical protein
MNPYGTWEVTTEGDCEGRSIRHLGTFTGYFDEIAFALAKKCYYALDFKRVENLDQFDKTPTKNKVVVRIWDFGKDIRYYERLLIDRGVFVKKSNIYESVTLHRTNPVSEEEMEAQRVRNMLLKQGVDVDKIKEFL